MAEIGAIKPNGFSVVSTFSGCGGSCLGYRMAGYRVLWANEFIPAAQETYRANHPSSILDGNDIREVKPEAILEATGLLPGQLDVLDGSPPCSSFSVAGKREKGWGVEKKYSDSEQRTDDLFFEYARILRGLQPKVFIAENVAGLLMGTAKGYFKLIYQELQSCGYTVSCIIADASWLGVPQARKRAIFVGVRNGIGIAPHFPKPFPYQYTLQDAIPWLRDPEQNPFPVEEETDISRYAIGKEWGKFIPGGKSEKYFSLVKPMPNVPCPTITATAGQTGAASVVHPFECRKFSVAEVKRICSFPDDFRLTGAYDQQVERMGRSVPPLMMKAISAAVADGILRRDRL